MNLLKKTMLILLLSAAAAFPAERKKRILVIHSYSRISTPVWVGGINKGISSVFSSGKYVISEFEMNTKVIPRSDFQNAADRAFDYYLKINPDLVFISDDDAFSLLGDRINSKIPVVFLGINSDIRADYPWVLNHSNITGVLERPVFRRAIIEINSVLDLNASKVLLLMGKETTAYAFFNVDLQKQEKFKTGEIDVEVLMTGSSSEWKMLVSRAKKRGYSFIMAAGYQAMKENGRSIPAGEFARHIAAVSTVPVFTIHGGYIGEGMFSGGMIISGIQMGEDAALIAKKILEENSSPQSISFYTRQTGEVIISRSSLLKWKLKVSPDYRNTVVYTN